MVRLIKVPTPIRLLVMVLLAVGLVSDAAQSTEFPLASTGDIWFQADHAGFLGDQGEVVEEYYFRITNNQLQFDPKDDGFGGRVFVRLKFKDEEDHTLSEASSNYEFQVPTVEMAQSGDDAQILVLREPLDLRAHSVEIQIEDLNARKRGILYMFTGKKKSGEARGTLIQPGFIGQDFCVSDIQFAWEVTENAAKSAFEKSGLRVVPNPSRNYGRLQPRLSVYYEVYDHRENRDKEQETYVVHHELIDPRDNVLPTTVDTVTSSSGEFIKVNSFDISKLTTGEYTLRAIVDHPRTGSQAVSERTFNLLWKSNLWAMTERDILDEARVLFAEKEYELFRGMSAGDRALHVEKFWLDKDPTPGTKANEIRDEFLRRVQFANRQYHSQTKGMLTDRGRMYIRFGEPDEVYRELMPTVDRQLDGYVGILTEENISGSLLATNDVIDTRPYEIWTYTRQGTPLFPDRERTTSVTGLRFVFVDETGLGHYVMRYSSDFIGY